MSEASVALVDRPDSVTHWSCPESGGDSHHIGTSSACVYCKKSVGQLRVEQAKLDQISGRKGAQR